MKVSAPLSLILLLGAGLAAASGPGKKSAGDGDQVAQVLSQIIFDSRSGHAVPRTFQVREDDLNAFLQDRLEMQAPAGLEKISTRLLEADSFISWLTIDMDQVELGEGSLTGMLLRGIFSGKQTIELQGKLEARGGRGRYTAERALLNGTPLPIPLLNTLLKAVGDRVQPPFDPTEPFPLPYGIESIRISTGQAELKTGSGGTQP